MPHAQSVVDRLATMGQNVIQVEAGNRNFKGASAPVETLSYQDVVAIRKECQAVAFASPQVDYRSQVAFEGRNWNTNDPGAGPGVPAHSALGGGRGRVSRTRG